MHACIHTYIHTYIHTVCSPVESSVSVGAKLGTGVGVTSSLLFYTGKRFFIARTGGKHNYMYIVWPK
jgi:hypothetical protein